MAKWPQLREFGDPGDTHQKAFTAMPHLGFGVGWLSWEEETQPVVAWGQCLSTCGHGAPPKQEQHSSVHRTGFFSVPAQAQWGEASPCSPKAHPASLDSQAATSTSRPWSEKPKFLRSYMFCKTEGETGRNQLHPSETRGRDAALGYLSLLLMSIAAKGCSAGCTSAHLLQKLPVPFPHLSYKPSGHLTHPLKPHEHTDLGFRHCRDQPGRAPPPPDGKKSS